MTKKPLSEPRVPQGPQFDFLNLLQWLVRRHGDLSLAQLTEREGLHCSRQVLHRALVGPGLPSRKLVEELVSVLGCTPDEMMAVSDAYQLAQEDQIQHRRLEILLPSSQSRLSSGSERIGRTSRTESKYFHYLKYLYKAAGSPPLSEIDHKWQGRNKISAIKLSDWLSCRSLPVQKENVALLGDVLARLAAERPGYGESGIRPSASKLVELWMAAKEGNLGSEILIV